MWCRNGEKLCCRNWGGKWVVRDKASYSGVDGGHPPSQVQAVPPVSPDYSLGAWPLSCRLVTIKGEQKRQDKSWPRGGFERNVSFSLAEARPHPPAAGVFSTCSPSTPAAILPKPCILVGFVSHHLSIAKPQLSSWELRNLSFLSSLPSPHTEFR